MARNTNQAPVVRRPELDALRDAVINSIAPIDKIAAAVDELLQRQQILEAAYLSLARDVEYILGEEGPEPEGEPFSADDYEEHPTENEVESYRRDTGVEETHWEDDGGAALPETDESPEEEAARLIAEAQATAEALNEGV
jgi:hypothetical protein